MEKKQTILIISNIKVIIKGLSKKDRLDNLIIRIFLTILIDSLVIQNNK